jgi:hypothetical protein
VRPTNPRFENLYDPQGFFPEAEGDRVRIAPSRARAEGIELAFRRLRRTMGWWTTYTFARAEDRIDGHWISRSWDERHAIGGGFDWTPADRWQLTVAGRIHSGRPTTLLLAEPLLQPSVPAATTVAFGARNSVRLPAYSRMDVRISRSFQIAGTDLRSSLTVTDAFDTCCPSVAASQPDLWGTAGHQPRAGLPRFITLGVTWKF